jgi:hypothetical protein
VRFVSPEYEVQLQELAEQLVTPERFHPAQKLGQLAVEAA